MAQDSPLEEITELPR